MKHKIFLGLIIWLILLSIFSTLAFASDNAPPALPTEYWGRALIDGNNAPVGTPITSNYGNTTVTGSGYDIILSGGDHELTNISDPTCAAAWAAGRACIPCSTNPADPNYCVEGPKDGDTIILNFDGGPVAVLWGTDQAVTKKILTQVNLYSGWNMVGIPVLPQNNSVQKLLSLLSGTRLADYYDATTATWKRYNSGTPPFTWTLSIMEPGKGYWIKVDSNQKWTLIGAESLPNDVPLKAGWNLVSFRLYNDSVQNAMSVLTGTKLADYYNNPTATWLRYNSGTPPFTWTLKEINIGKGYWVKVDSNQTWGEP